MTSVRTENPPAHECAVQSYCNENTDTIARSICLFKCEKSSINETFGNILSNFIPTDTSLP